MEEREMNTHSIAVVFGALLFWGKQLADDRVTVHRLTNSLAHYVMSLYYIPFFVAFRMQLFN